MDCLAFLQQIFPTQRSNPCLLCLLHWQAGFLLQEPPGKPKELQVCLPLNQLEEITLQIGNEYFYDLTDTRVTPSVLSVQFSSVVQSCPTLCDPMNCSTPGLPVHHQLPEFTQTHAHRVGAAIQPSHPLSFPSPPAPNPSQHQGLFQ